MIDASLITKHLYQGSAPPSGDHLARAGIQTLVLCAEEYQGGDYPGIRVVRAPYRDTLQPELDELRMARRAAKEVAQEVASGRCVLVTCRMGWNRSGLVTALALRRLRGISGKEAYDLVQKKRPKALSNPTFAAILKSLPRPRRPGVGQSK